MGLGFAVDEGLGIFRSMIFWELNCEGDSTTGIAVCNKL